MPESLTCLTVWKRYNDVKKLRKQIVRRHRELRVAGPAVPALSDDGYFRRFDSDVILARKQHILHFLDFIAQHPCLYKSHAFVQFFEVSQSPALTPLKQQQRRRDSAIASICGEIEVPQLAGNDEFNLIDPQRDEGLRRADSDADVETRQRRSANDCANVMSSSLASSSTLSSDTTSVCSEAGEDPSAPHSPADADVDEVDCAVEAFADGCLDDDNDHCMVQSRPPAASTADYIFEAALEFSEAVRAEVARNYRQSFELYKSGIGRLIHGVRMDACAERRRVAKDKINKYMLRAEQIYACHLADCTDDASAVNRASRPVRMCSSNAKRPPSDRLMAFEELSRIKVLRVMHGVMQVQDTYDQSIYVMRAIEKPANFSVKLFEHARRPVRGMVSLVSFFVSETTVYLLLQQASGGRLWDYIRSHQASEDDAAALQADTDKATLNSLFLEPGYPVRSLDASDDDDVDDDAFLGTLKKLRSPEHQSEPTDQQQNDGLDASLDQRQIHVPAFDKLTPTMAVSDLLSCSQRLLDSVTSTIERSNNDAEDVHGSTTTLTNNPVEEIFLRQDTKTSAIITSMHRTTVSPRSRPHCRTSAIPLRSIVGWASELCRTIDDLHANGIHCGDLHADNLLLGPGGQLLLSYFYPKPTLTPTVADCMYLAPERPLTAKSDWWSFGVLLFELLTCEQFFDCHPAGLAAYCDIQYPDDSERVLSAEARDLIGGTVLADAERRLDGAAIRKHAFFRDIDWGVEEDDKAVV